MRRGSFARAETALMRILLRLLIRKSAHPTVRLGSSYGGWVIPAGVLTQGAVCYCVGAGEDITFDLALTDLGCDVVIVDPTPRSVRYVEAMIKGRDRVRLVPVGLWSADTDVAFYAPRDPNHVSHSIVNLQHTSNYFVAKCVTLATLMQLEGHSAIDLLKLDVEGAEFEIIHDILARGTHPRVLCVEFDAPFTVAAVWSCIRELARLDYRAIAIDGLNVTFLRKSGAAQ